MNEISWDRAAEILEAAAELSADERGEYVARSCADDERLRREVLSLLVAHDDQGPFDRLGSDLVGNLGRELRAGDRIGPYSIRRLLGRGGMGAVYLAERDDPDFPQTLALKVLAGAFDEPDLVQRFLAERRILARLQHANIARLLDGGVDGAGRPYFAMELVDGEPIDQYCDDQRLDLRARLRLFLLVCDAVAHAHRHLIVHRDLKPNNILVTEIGEVKLLDFGIAKLLAPDDLPDSSLTRTGWRWLTPDFASPEQVAGEPVTTVSDVYSLGVLLYLLLTGRSPYRVASRMPHALEQAICEQEPERPSTAARRAIPSTAAVHSEAEGRHGSEPRRFRKLRKQLVGDLDTIVLKALSKDPAQRYSSAVEVAEDIERFLTGMPIEARPATFRYRATKFVKRHRLAVVAATLLAFSVLTGIGTTLWQADLAKQQALAARAERDKARVEAAKAERVAGFVVRLFETADPGRARGQTLTVREVLERGASRVDSELAAEPAVKAQMLEVVGRVYHSLGLLETAEEFLARSADMRGRLDGSELELAAALHALGLVRYDRGDLEAAEALLREALAVRRQGLPDLDPDLAASHHDLGFLLAEKGQAEEAESHLLEALETRQTIFGVDHPETAETEFALGAVRHHRMDVKGAEEHFRRAVAAIRRSPERSDPTVAARSLGMLGTLLYFRGALDEAEPMLREALDIRRSVYEGDHQLIAESLQALAFVCLERSEFRRSAELFDEAVAMGERVVGHTPFVARMLQGQARALAQLERFDEAERMLRDALDVNQREYGVDHPYFVQSLQLLAAVQLDRGRHAAAMASYQRALEISERVLGVDHPTYAASLRGLGEVDLVSDRLEAAETRLRRALAIFRSSLRPDHFHLLETQHLLGRALGEIGRTEEAEALLREALAGRRRTLNEGHLLVGDTLFELAGLLTSTGRSDEAKPMLEEALAIRRSRLAEGSPRIADAEAAWARAGGHAA